MKKQDVKITTRGKVSLRISSSLKPFFLACLEQSLSMSEWSAKTQLDLISVGEKIKFAQLSEIYMRHFTALNMSNQECRVLLTLPQALLLWQLSQENEMFYDNAQMGALLMQLHQRLS